MAKVNILFYTLTWQSYLLDHIVRCKFHFDTACQQVNGGVVGDFLHLLLVGQLSWHILDSCISTNIPYQWNFWFLLELRLLYGEIPTCKNYQPHSHTWVIFATCIVCDHCSVDASYHIIFTICLMYLSWLTHVHAHTRTHMHTYHTQTQQTYV